MQKGLVSIIMPVYNAELYLCQTIKSVLAQSFNNYEFIIINDGSTDKSEAVILSFNDARIRYIRNDCNLKLISTLNKGIDLAKGEFIARIDADDIALSDWLSNAMLGFNDAPYASIVNQRDYEMDDDGKYYWKRRFFPYLTNDQLKYSQLLSTQILHPGIVVKTDKIKMYRYLQAPHTIHQEDFDLWKRMLIDGCYVKVMQTYAVLHRRAKGSITNTQHTDYMASMAVFDEDIKRCGFQINKEAISFLKGNAYTSSTTPIVAVNEWNRFMMFLLDEYHITNLDYNYLSNWILQTITCRVLREAKSINRLSSFMKFIIKFNLFFKYWFWKNIFYYLTNIDKHPISKLLK